MKLYTKTGDGGQTRLGDRTTVEKDHPRVATYGDVDEHVFHHLLSRFVGKFRKAQLQIDFGDMAAMMGKVVKDATEALA